MGEESPIQDARRMGLDAVQIFLGDPQSFRKPAPREDAQELRGAEIPVFVHAPYRLNPCHPSPRIRVPSRKTLAQNVDAAAAIGAAGVIVHGGHAEDDPVEGPMRWWKVFDERQFPVRVLIENTAGGSNAVARYVDQIARLWEKLEGFDVGFCFDTCHAHAAHPAGEDLVKIVERLVGIVGTIDVFHCNDSRDLPGTGADRHANIAKGKMDPEVIKDMILASKAPVLILETPWPGVTDDLKWVRELLGDNV